MPHIETFWYYLNKKYFKRTNGHLDFWANFDTEFAADKLCRGEVIDVSVIEFFS